MEVVNLFRYSVAACLHCDLSCVYVGVLIDVVCVCVCVYVLVCVCVCVCV